ncbi:MAG: phycobilisome protein [Synechococcales bacterium]|nr:phycobilisome protein [Synechococcales bacterium]
MLSQFQLLSQEAEGRYATDNELKFVTDYINSFPLRLQTYQKVHALESKIIQDAYAKMEANHPKLLRVGSQDMRSKWKRDTLRVLRYSAIALLLDDPDLLQERFLFWFQTIMRAFGTQESCEVTYSLMQEVVKDHLSPIEAALFCPLLELNRVALGVTA